MWAGIRDATIRPIPALSPGRSPSSAREFEGSMLLAVPERGLRVERYGRRCAALLPFRADRLPAILRGLFGMDTPVAINRACSFRDCGGFRSYARSSRGFTIWSTGRPGTSRVLFAICPQRSASVAVVVLSGVDAVFPMLPPSDWRRRSPPLTAAYCGCAVRATIPSNTIGRSGASSRRWPIPTSSP